MFHSPKKTKAYAFWASICLLTLLPVVTGRGQQGLGASDRHWIGFDPFSAPSRTTDYYGSGDIDLDGNITRKDLDLVREMIAGTRPPNVRADVDGNGVVDDADLQLLETALQGGPLPGWWNSLTTPAARADWVQRLLALDFNQLVHNQEAEPGWACDDYAKRCFLRFTPQVLDPSNPLYQTYGIAQTTFNLPVYIVAVTAPGFGHSLNAILIGDDPTVFTNWCFLEPETGSRAQPGGWDLPWGAQIEFQRPDPLNAPYHSLVSLLSFQLAQPRVLAGAVDPALLRQRPSPGSQPIHNNPDIWQPVLLPDRGGMVLFNKSRDDLWRSVAVHLLASPDGDPNGAAAVFPPGGFNRLLATAPASPGSYHLLWVCHTNRHMELLYGKLDTQAASMSGCRVVATNVVEGSLLGVSTNEVFVFYATPDGLTSLHQQGGQWGNPETVLQWTTLPSKIGSPCFGAARGPDGHPRVIWADETTQDGPFQTTIFQTQRGSAWGAPETVAVVDGFIPTLGVARDSLGSLHLVYANTWYPVFDCYSEGLPAELWQVVRGDIQYCADGPTGWAQPQTVATNSFWPSLVLTRRDEVILAWETDQAGGVVPVWTDYTAATLPQAFGTEGTPYYPVITETANGALLLAWSETSQRGSSFNYQVIREPETISVGIAAGPNGIEITWQAQTGGTFQVESSQANGPASWQPWGPSIITQSNYGSMIVPVDRSTPFRLYRVTKF